MQCMVCRSSSFPKHEVILSGMANGSTKCQCLDQGSIRHLPELDLNWEEADVCIIPHTMYTANGGSQQVVILSPDTDVLVLAIYFTDILMRCGVKEIWI